jgi:hypothetical protein
LGAAGLGGAVLRAGVRKALDGGVFLTSGPGGRAVVFWWVVGGGLAGLVACPGARGFLAVCTRGCWEGRGGWLFLAVGAGACPGGFLWGLLHGGRPRLPRVSPGFSSLWLLVCCGGRVPS